MHSRDMHTLNHASFIFNIVHSYIHIYVRILTLFACKHLLTPHECNNVQANKRKDTQSFPKTNYINFAYLKRKKVEEKEGEKKNTQNRMRD